MCCWSKLPVTVWLPIYSKDYQYYTYMCTYGISTGIYHMYLASSLVCHMVPGTHSMQVHMTTILVHNTNDRLEDPNHGIPRGWLLSRPEVCYASVPLNLKPPNFVSDRNDFLFLVFGSIGVKCIGWANLGDFWVHKIGHDSLCHHNKPVAQMLAQAIRTGSSFSEVRRP
jgi:hypothetical protein